MGHSKGNGVRPEPRNNGRPGETVFVAADLGLAQELRACGFKAACSIDDAGGLHEFVDRRRVIVAYRSRSSKGFALGVSEHLLSKHAPADVGLIDLEKDLLVSRPFGAWWADQLQEGSYDSGVDFEARVRELARTSRPTDPGRPLAPVTTSTLDVEWSDDGDDAEAESEPWPDLCFREEPEAPPFPIHVFPLPLRRYCLGVAEVTLTPPDLAAVAMLATASAAVGQSVNVSVKRTWKESPLLYILIVADPGRAKSPVIKLVVRPLTKIDMRLRQESADLKKTWEEAKKNHGKDPDNHLPPGPEPAQRRGMVKDVTRETLVTILKDNPRGLLADPDEATGWVGSFNEYKGKGTDRQFWLDIWGSRPISVDREGGKRSSWVGSPLVTVLGGLPPAMLGSLSEDQGRDDGFLDRILFSFPGEFPKQVWSEDELDEGEESVWFHVIERLHSQMMAQDKDGLRPNFVGFTPDAKLAWIEFFNRHCEEMEDDDLLPICVGFWSKLRAYAARFCLILSRLRLVLDPESCDVLTAPVDLMDVLGACSLVDYFKAQVLRVHHRMTGGTGSRDARIILAWIQRKELSEFSERDLLQDHRRRFPDSPAIQAPLKSLVQAGAIRLRDLPIDPSRRGRRPSPRYEANPALKDLRPLTQNTHKSQNSPEA